MWIVLSRSISLCILVNFSTSWFKLNFKFLWLLSLINHNLFHFHLAHSTNLSCVSVFYILFILNVWDHCLTSQMFLHLYFSAPISPPHPDDDLIAPQPKQGSFLCCVFTTANLDNFSPPHLRYCVWLNAWIKRTLEYGIYEVSIHRKLKIHSLCHIHLLLYLTTKPEIAATLPCLIMQLASMPSLPSTQHYYSLFPLNKTISNQLIIFCLAPTH
jgi:hypothetical protein